MSEGCADRDASDGAASFLFCCSEKGNGDGAAAACKVSAAVSNASGSENEKDDDNLCDVNEGAAINDIVAFQGRKKGSYGGSSKVEACINALNYDYKHASHGNCPRDRLQRHRLLVAGKVQIPDVWYGEERLHEWVRSHEVEEALRPPDLFSARAALMSARRTRPGPPTTTTCTTLCEVSLQS